MSSPFTIHEDEDESDEAEYVPHEGTDIPNSGTTFTAPAASVYESDGRSASYMPAADCGDSLVRAVLTFRQQRLGSGLGRWFKGDSAGEGEIGEC